MSTDSAAAAGTAPQSAASILRPERRGVARGSVVVRGTGAPVSGVIAQLVAIKAPDVNAGAAAISLGSSPVDSVGNFAISYTLRNEPTRDTEPRPDLRVAILGPGSGNGEALRLAESDIRSRAADSEYFLIQVDAEKLAEHGIVTALAAATRSHDATIAARAITVERERSMARRNEMQAVRRESVDEARVVEKERQNKIRDRVLAHMTKVTPDSDAWKRLVAPGENAQDIASTYQKAALSGPIKRTTESGTVTYLVLSDSELADLGTPPESDKIEALLRRRDAAPELVRADLLARCRDHANETSSPPPNPSAPGTGTPSAPTAADADAKVRELVNAIVPPDQLIIEQPFGPEGVASRVRNLSLAKGPADVPAYYDFHRLELAFDHVWEDARADGYIERANDLYRVAEELGGDPDSALQSPEPPLRALAREASLAVRANEFELTAKSTGPGWIARFTRPTGPVDPLSPDDVRDMLDSLPPPDTPPIPPPPRPPDRPTLPEVGIDINPVVHPGNAINEDAGEYPFTVFAADTVNFGLLITYEQCFKPVNYQVGRLVSTRTLGPKETYSFTTRQVVKTSYNRKQIRSNQQMKRDETEDTYRDEAEIVNRAQAKTNFALSTSGSYDLGPLGEGSATTSMGRDAETSSQEAKRAQRSAVRKSAQQVTSETRIELEQASIFETETVEKREIQNPNDELALTCIFYELQRRFQVYEQLRCVMPVILVAQYVPRPEEINEEWILRHDWIIRRFLPDDSFEPALTYLSTRAAGDQVILADLLEHMTQIRATVRELRTEILSVRARAERQLEAIQRYVNQQSDIVAAADSDGWLENAWETVAGKDEGSRDAIRILEEAARERYEKAVRDEQDLRARLERESTALQVATDEYVKALAEHRNHRVEIDRLIKHIRAYILHYMQGIWSYEHPDQLFFRQHTLTAPRLESLTRTCTLTPENGWPDGVAPVPGKKCYRVTFTTEVAYGTETDASGNTVDKRATLAELADLDRVIGYKGNYIIYPLKESNALTDYMMMPYIDTTLGLRDPDGAGNWTLEEFKNYVECLRTSLTPAEFDEIAVDLEKQTQEILASPHRDGEFITIPTNSLYMQMLADSGKALEPFKEAHRQMDVLKVRSEVRSAELDNCRRAKLVLTDKLEDPNVEAVKNVYYHGPAPHDGDE